MDTVRSLQLIGDVFGKLGWERRLCDLTEEEVLGVIVVMQSVKDIEDEYLSENLREIFDLYKPQREQDGGIPF